MSDEPAGIAERLRRMEAVVDSTLSKLESDELLSELLDRVCHLLEVDIAAILLLDIHAQQLVTTAVKGLEDEIRSGFRLSIGRGFAGRIAAQRAPVVLDEVRPTDVASGALRRLGVRSLAGVPMLVGGDLVGVMQVGTLEPRKFTADDVQLLQLAADRAATACQARLSRQDRSAVLALQRSLLPTRLPAVEGLEFAARYVPGHDTGVGGDWYDVFHLPDRGLGIVVGDVAGHGPAAALVMGRLRSALRAYALECADPADALMRLDRKMQHFEPGSLATALYAIVAPHRASLAISLGGHPPPVVADREQAARLLELPVDLPLGTGGDPPRRTTTVDLAAGSVLVFYTDGLYEQRGHPVDAGLARLIAAVEGERGSVVVEPGSAEAVCATIMGAMETEAVSDDVAILTLRRR